MDAGRAHKVESLYHAALELETAERPAFLLENCGSDQSLRLEVESLLLYDRNAGDFLAAPAAGLLSRRSLPAPGDRVSCYEILAQVGEGGMGVVFKARDTRLNRLVAIKFSSSPFNRRFEREARSAAALNHPNICGLYDIGPDYLVMEYVEGQPLTGPLPVEKAVPYAIQITAALEAAHDKGFVHRDLKPANIKVTPEGVIKLLDFGLAKHTQAALSSSSMTRAGTIIGTVTYMSPEQARGTPVDKRADIWAFGVVLFEMLAGHPPFSGETTSDILAAVLAREPDWQKLPNNTPPYIRRLLEHCLRKDPNERLRDIRDARLELEAAEAPQPQSARRWLPWAVAALALAVAAVALFRPASRPLDLAPMRFPLPFPDGTNDRGVPSAFAPEAVPSPDGRNIAFIAGSFNQKGSLWLRPSGSVQAHRLGAAENPDLPFWSPDGKFIGFFSGMKLKKVSIAGGPPETICDVLGVAGLPDQRPGGATWNADDTIVFATASLMRVPAAGGIPTPINQLDTPAGERRSSAPQFLPDGRHLLYFSENTVPAKNAVYVLDLSSAKRTLVMRSQNPAAWAPPGYLLFERNATLFAQRLDANSFQLTGEPVVVADEVAHAAFAASANGVLVYSQRSSQPTGQLAWYDRDGKRLGALGQPAPYQSVKLSPDNKKVKLVIGPTYRGDTWIMDLATGVLDSVTHQARSSVSSGPWSPDSSRTAINWSLARGAVLTALYSGYTQTLGSGVYVEDWSPDGRSLLCRDSTGGRVLVFSADRKGPPRTLVTTPYFITDLRFSPDGRSVAYTTVESGREEIEIASYPSFTGKRQVSTEGGSYPTWRNDGKELFFRAASGTLMTADVNMAAATQTGIPHPVFKSAVSVPPYGYAPTSDATRFLVIDGQPTHPAQNVVLVNWTAVLNR